MDGIVLHVSEGRSAETLVALTVVLEQIAGALDPALPAERRHWHAGSATHLLARLLGRALSH